MVNILLSPLLRSTDRNNQNKLLLLNLNQELGYVSKVPKNNPRLLHPTDWTGIAQIQITHGIYCTQDNTDSKGPRNSNSNQIHNMSLCTSRHFYACTDRRTVCATVHHSFIPAAQFYIYVALFTYLPVYAQQQEVQKKCNIHRPTPFIHRFIFIKLFRFADALLFALVFNN